jgi:hypothetical protein
MRRNKTLHAIVVAWWEGELDRKRLEAGLNRQVDPSSLTTAVTVISVLEGGYALKSLAQSVAAHRDEARASDTAGALGGAHCHDQNGQLLAER